MIVTLDGRRLLLPPSPGSTLRTLIDQVRADLPPDRLVVSVVRNGELLIDRELEEWLARPLSAADRVDLATADRRELTAEALREVAGRIGAAGREQERLAGQLNRGQTTEAVGQFSAFVASFQACRQVIAQSSDLLGRDLTAESSEGRTVGAHLEELAERLREVRDALEAGDYVLLADLLHYELPPLCQTWARLLESLADSIAPRPGAGS
jgi:hypothetical protein